MKAALPALLALFALAACGKNGDERAEQLRAAAAQSTPPAAQVLNNNAERIEDRDIDVPASAPGSPTQEALARAGQAEVTNNRTGQPAAPPPHGAKPHAANDQVPPPQVPPPG